MNTINEWSPYPKNKDWGKKVERTKIVPNPNPYDDKKGWSKNTDKTKDGDWYKNESINLSSRYLHKIITESIQKLIFEKGDYVSSGYADKDGEIYRNPKNRHIKKVKIDSKYENKPNKVGDYVSSGYADKDGRIFRNPKNGHVKRIKEGFVPSNYDDENLDDLHSIVKESVNKALNEAQVTLSPSHEARLRTVVGELAQQIGSILRKLTMYDRGMNNYLADLVQNEKWVDDLYGVYYSMKEFAEATPQVDASAPV